MTIGPLRREDGAALIALYEDALPPAERKPSAAILAYPRRADRRVIGARAADGRLIGFAILYVAARVALLEYMATHPDARGGGLGGQLFAAALAAAEGRPMLIEVDSDRAATEDDPARRRKRFYRRLGCVEIAGLAYRMPALNAARPPAMELLAHLNGRDRPIGRAELAGWLTGIFTEVYAQAAAERPVAAMLAALEDPVMLA
ncbi:GNAT family N-acetyltransferase [Sphingomonas flavalba]|uniref:GNAT family N-acetyltransferase n=1 Tax=Sphingomonas flavalba TaxID=2559804 RepID=UPI001445375F|nr:GNAT family N-acetyltransferase [Sphingomonas flavalba]